MACPGFELDRFTLSYIVIPGHALHEKGLQSQLGVGTMISNEERRAAVVPQINRG